MKPFLVTILILFSYKALSQSENAFNIEKLSTPKDFIRLRDPEQVFSGLKGNFEKYSQLPDSLAFYGEHAFLKGILTAYKEHRPFTISPDIIWLLISQGFARHISNNAEEFRKTIVNFKEKKSLVVVTDNIRMGNPSASNWEAVFPQFTDQINDYTGKELSNVLTANFSTTTAISEIASRITIMETVKEYFNYKVIMVGCGIPRITIEGTIKDWESILIKIKYISKYKLEWWTSELEPIINQIIAAKKGAFHKGFWMNMVKAHSKKVYGSPTTINGWIVKFFPYTKEGKRTGLKAISDIDSLASEIVKVPFILEDAVNKKSYKLEFWSGFIGLSQNKSDYTLKPEIFWAVNNKAFFDSEKSEFKYQKEIDDLSITNVSEIPDDIYSLGKIGFLHIRFLQKISIPTELAKIKIENLDLTGTITLEEELRIKKLFSETKLTINGIPK